MVIDRIAPHPRAGRVGGGVGGGVLHLTGGCLHTVDSMRDLNFSR